MSTASASSSDAPASSVTIAVISLVSEAIGVTSSAPFAYSGRWVSASMTSAFAEASLSLAGSGADTGCACPPADAAAAANAVKTIRNRRFMRLSLRIFRVYSMALRPATTRKAVENRPAARFGRRRIG